MKISEGCVYTNRTGCFAREITEIKDGQVHYRDFALSDGRPLDSLRVCARGTFRNWAFRLCTPAEIASFRRDEMPQDDQLAEDLMGQIAAVFRDARHRTL